MHGVTININRDTGFQVQVFVPPQVPNAIFPSTYETLCIVGPRSSDGKTSTKPRPRTTGKGQRFPSKARAVLINSVTGSSQLLRPLHNNLKKLGIK